MIYNFRNILGFKPIASIAMGLALLCGGLSVGIQGAQATEAANAALKEFERREDVLSKALFLPHVKIVDTRFWPGNVKSAIEKAGLEFLYVSETVEPGDGRYRCSAMSDAQISNSRSFITNAVQKLPASVYKDVNLKYVLLCDSAQANEQEIGGIPIPPLKLMMLSAGSDDNGYKERMFFHEFYHYFEFMVRHSLKDAEWDKRFEGFYVGLNGADTNMSVAEVGTASSKGFVTRYAQTGAEEDRAEIFSFIYAAPDELEFFIRKKNDEVLKEKVKYIQNIVSEHLGLRANKKF
ncbi:MAG: hypothetical protein CMH26_06115 [Micavibrio sp.]|nr:hypothetical protein [Micavibrio sp.]|tara:strand:+ start:3164 stop:4042 length:879 start_codon:yes stop_codon:yes gene_type:complete